MKGNWFHILLIGCCFLYSCDTESNVEPNFENFFIKYYGGEGNQTGVDLIALPDGYAVLGTNTSSSGESSMFLVRTNELGNEQWSIDVGGDMVEANALALDNSGNYILLGTHTNSATDKDVILLRISSEGVQLDSTGFGSVGTIEEGNDLTITSNGDIILVGSTTNVDTTKPGYNATTDLSDIYSVRLDAGFIPYTPTNWRRVSGFPGIEEGATVLEKPDGTFLFFGTTDRPPSSNQKDGFNMFLYPAGNDGEALSITTLQLFGTLSDESGSQMVQTVDGGYVMIGTSSTGQANDIFLARVRSNNDFISSSVLNSGRNLSGASIFESTFGGLILLGKELENNTNNLYLARTSVDGSLIWEQSFGGVDDDQPGRLLENADGSIVFSGTIELESQTKMCLIKVNSSGELKPN